MHGLFLSTTDNLFSGALRMDDFIRKVMSGMIASGKPHPLDRPHAPASMEPNYGPDADPSLLPPSVTRKVLMITHNPVLHSKGGHTLKQVFNWNDSNTLA